MPEEKIKLLRCESLEETIRYLKSSDIRDDSKQYILMFIDELKIKGFSQFRIMAYALTLIEFAKIVNKSFNELTAADFRYYVNVLLNEKHNKHSTIREKMMRIRVFMRWLLDLPPRTTPDPMKWFFTISPKATKGNKILEILEKVIDDYEYNALLNAARRLRDKALLQFLYETGSRILEALEVRIKDVNVEENYAIVGGGKRLVPIVNSEWVKKWLEEHPQRHLPEAYLFCSLRNPKKPLSYPAVRRLLKRLAKIAHLKKRVTCHMFRHTRATLLAKFGVSPYAMNQVMGWSASTKMWQVYLHITQKDALREILEKFSRRHGNSAENTTRTDKST
ncbi:MAG: tyrosine-type recombinase/integrase [Candidatus Korarchaeota archaeon]|nr:tyrosine-type recombinase/integrase [Thermoproteota archaeon]MCR8455336.1 tyrosine-type recombinase/integrase [Thermoproteota archaeon]MCR8462606.1 tyrosine-type recombinase/integrase [Thermoproteota archaeon]MCR8472377.1 tyrosine-type recombinase/integrase [Thermoproteota archaeon]MCR8472889.1 tyrosine-type recombinase/integrase [Thermoproteota archaeon]